MAITFQDYYETLALKRDASAEDIKLAFRKLARIHHPDVAKNKVTGEARFKEINEAYEVLSDPQKRRRYDELGANWQEPAGRDPGENATPRNWRQAARGNPDFEFKGTGFSDFFESFFSGDRHGFGTYGRPETRFHAGAQPHTANGADIEADILVTLEEALRGSVRKVTLRRPQGADAEARSDTYQVHIPPGVREAQRIRLAGQGDPGPGGGSSGDLYLRVRLARHPDFRVQDADLYSELLLAPWEAVLGVHITIPTLDGPTKLHILPGTKAGSRLRLRGLGLPNENKKRGDLYATVGILTPETVTTEERSLWEHLGRLSTFNPRNDP